MLEREKNTNRPNKFCLLPTSPDSSGIILVEQVHEFALQG